MSSQGCIHSYIYALDEGIKKHSVEEPLGLLQHVEWIEQLLKS